MRRFLKSTTSLVLCASLVLPLPYAGPVAAQEGLPQCGDKAKDTPLPCLMGETVVETKRDWRVANLIRNGKAASVEEAEQILAERRAQRQQEKEAEAAAEAQAAAEQAEAEAAAQQAEELAAAAQAQAEAEAQAAAEAEAQAAAEAEAQAAAEAEAQAAAEAEAQAAAEAEAQAAAEAEAQAAAEAEAQAQAEAQAAEDAAAEAEARIAADLAEAEAAAAAEQETTQATEEAQPQVATASGFPVCGDRARDTPLPCEMSGMVAETKRDWRILRLMERGRAASVEEAEQILAERRAERQATAAAAATDADASDTAVAETETETVTAEDTRQADEEFDTAVTATGQQSVDDDDELSKFEKALLLGLGAVVVGSILNNGDEVVSRTGDRVVVETPDGDLRVLKDDDALIRRPGDQVQTQTFSDGSTRTIVTKPDGSQVITVRGRDGAVIKRVSVDVRGTQYVMIDDTQAEQEIVVEDLPDAVAPVRQASAVGSEDELRRALQAELRGLEGQGFSLRQIREIREVRALAPELELDAIRFASGSAAIRPEQARALAKLGRAVSDVIRENPRTVILVEGHTDAVGDATYNLALSDRRAETVALALAEYFDVPAANMVTQGYGERYLKVPTLLDEAANRRAVVRNITGLLR